MIINFPAVGIHGHKPIFAAVKFCTAEGGTSGKNSSTDQRQIQATSQSGAVFVGDGPVNTGTSLTNSGAGSINVLDAGAVDRAFDFGEFVAGEASKIFLNQASVQKDTITANSNALTGLADLIASNSAGGANKEQSKLLLYLGLGALVVVAIIFLRR